MVEETWLEFQPAPFYVSLFGAIKFVETRDLSVKKNITMYEKGTNVNGAMKKS